MSVLVPDWMVKVREKVIVPVVGASPTLEIENV